MKKRILLCALFVMVLATNIYAAEALVGQWTAMSDPCFLEFTNNSNKTVTLWLACWDTEGECFEIGYLYGSWQKMEKGIYSISYGPITDILFVKGTVGTTSENLTLLKGVPLKATKDALYQNSCY